MMSSSETWFWQVTLFALAIAIILRAVGMLRRISTNDDGREGALQRWIGRCPRLPSMMCNMYAHAT